MKDSEIIKQNRDFSAVCRRGHKYNGKYLSLFVMKNRRGLKRIGFATSRKFPNAVTRNRAKRLIREAYRCMESEVSPGKDVVVLMKVLNEPDFSALCKDLKKLLTQAELIGE